MGLSNGDRVRRYRAKRKALVGERVKLPPAQVAVDIIALRSATLHRLSRIAERSEAKPRTWGVCIAACATLLKHVDITPDKGFIAMMGGPQNALEWLARNREKLVAHLQSLKRPALTEGQNDGAELEGRDAQAEQGSEAEAHERAAPSDGAGSQP